MAPLTEPGHLQFGLSFVAVVMVPLHSLPRATLDAGGLHELTGPERISNRGVCGAAEAIAFRVPLLVPSGLGLTPLRILALPGACSFVNASSAIDMQAVRG